MSIKRSICAAPVIAIFLLGLVLAVMVYFSFRSDAVRDKSRLLTEISTVIQDVDALGEGIAEPGGEGRSLVALTAHAQQVRVHLRVLGSLPQQAALAERLTQMFEAWYRPAMQARLMSALDGDPIALTEVIEQQHAVLQLGLEDARLLALRRFADSALEDTGRVKDMLEISVAVILLLIAILGRLAWVAMCGDAEQTRAATSIPLGASHADSQQRALGLLKALHGHVDTLTEEARTLVADRKESARSQP